MSWNNNLKLFASNLPWRNFIIQKSSYQKVVRNASHQNIILLCFFFSLSSSLWKSDIIKITSRTKVCLPLKSPEFIFPPFLILSGKKNEDAMASTDWVVHSYGVKTAPWLHLSWKVSHWCSSSCWAHQSTKDMCIAICALYPRNRKCARISCSFHTWCSLYKGSLIIPQQNSCDVEKIEGTYHSIECLTLISLF